MKHPLTNTYLDILTPRERRFYDSYQSGRTLAPHEVGLFDGIMTKRTLFAREQAFINRLARSTAVSAKAPGQQNAIRQVLYEAWVWAQKS